MITILTQRIMKLGAMGLVRARKRRPEILYFAYGANLDAARFEKYEMSFEAVGPARLVDYQLTFTFPCEYLGKGFGDITAAPGAEVWGYLYRLDRASMLLLDVMEWAALGHYRRITVDVDGQSAQVYQARYPREGLVPSRGYRDAIVKTARRHGFAESYVAGIESAPCGDKFPLDPAFSLIFPPRPRLGVKWLGGIYGVHDRLRERLGDWLRF